MDRSLGREAWVDDVKVVACLLVVLGHFFQGMVKASILADGPLNGWFQMTIYTFHVPLFFVCSGYLYQRYGLVDSPRSWFHTLQKKALALGVPYVTFTSVTLAMKSLAGDAANTQESGVLQTLLLRPAAPYWYLYTLFFIFVVTPTADGTVSAITMLSISVALRLVFLIGGLPSMPYAVSSVMRYWCWFVAGMCLSSLGWRDLLTRRAGIACLAFLPLSVLAFVAGLGEAAQLALGIVACACVLALCLSTDPARRPRWLDACARFTMPVFLMHTIFAAGLRVVLVRMGVTSAVVHVPLGLVAGLVGPALAMLAMERLRPLDFLVYPTRYARIGGSS